MNYLKALGVLRLVSEQDPAARGKWEAGCFVLQSKYLADTLARFFRDDYAPSPILAPWGARSGFYPGNSEKGAREALNKITSQKHARFTRFNQGAADVRRLLARFNISEKAKEKEKLKLLTDCRSGLDDEMLSWLDSCYILTAHERKFPPLFGTGGNEGSGSFVSGFAQRVGLCLVDRAYDAALDAALFATPNKNTTTPLTPGHFSPSASGGPNGGQGIEAKPGTNPWDYLLAVEGACLWASGVMRRFGQAGSSIAAFPFTVEVSGIGAGSLANKDARRPKAAKREIAEIWLPTWERPMNVHELSALLAEGRATIGKRLAATGLDFARAASSLGVDRGISAFYRTAFLMRNGQSFMAISLGRFNVRVRQRTDLLRELDRWLGRYRLACTDKSPQRFNRALRRIESAIFEFCRHDGTEFFRTIVAAVGRGERELATGESFRTSPSTGRLMVPPLQRLSTDWIDAANDGTPEFDVALSLAGIFDRSRALAPIRANLEPVISKGERIEWVKNSPSTVWSGGSLYENLSKVLARRVLEAERANCEALPIESVACCSLPVLARFLAGELDEQRIEELLWGLAPIERGSWPRIRAACSDMVPVLPRPYALLKLLFLPLGRHRYSHPDLPSALERLAQMPREPAILPLVRANRIGEACLIATRRLRAAGFEPRPFPRLGDSSLDRAWLEAIPSHLPSERLAAALLIPVSNSTISHLAHLCLRTPKTTKLETHEY